MLSSQLESFSLAFDFPPKLAICLGFQLGRGEALFECDLLFAGLVQAQEAGGEQNRVCHVFLELSIDRASDESFFGGVGHELICVTVGRVVKHDVDTRATNDAHDCFLGSEVDSNSCHFRVFALV